MDTATDRVSLEIIGWKLLAIADEMGIVLARSSMSPVIYEVVALGAHLGGAHGVQGLRRAASAVN